MQSWLAPRTMRPFGGTPLTTARRVLAAFLVLGAALAAFDVLLVSGAIDPWAQGPDGCGARASSTPPDRSAAAAAPVGGLLRLRLSDRRPTALVTDGAAGLNHPVFSPDGRRIAFIAASNGIVARLEVCDLRRHTLEPVPMSIPAGDFPLSWDGKSGSLVFVGGDLLGYGADQRPFVVDPSGHRIRQLAGDSPWYYDGVSVSPDGTKLALLLQRKYPGGSEPEQLAVLDLRTGTLERIVGSSQVAEIDGVSWSPDGTRLVLSAYRQNPHGGLYVVDVATHALTPLLVRGPGARAPAWSPDGRSIAFVRGGPHTGSIWLLDLRSGRTRRLTWGGVDLAPAWSPNGKALVFVRRGPAAT